MGLFSASLHLAFSISFWLAGLLVKMRFILARFLIFMLPVISFPLNMAININIVAGCLITQLSIALALTLQLYGLLFLWKSHEMQAGNFAIATLATQRSSHVRKFRKAKLRRLSRKGRSSWFLPGRTDQISHHSHCPTGSFSSPLLHVKPPRVDW